jgi:DNA gyrase subunit A
MACDAEQSGVLCCSLKARPGESYYALFRKEGDTITQTVESSNAKELLFFTDQCQVYKARVADFEDSKASLLGDYVPTVLEFDEGEKPVYMAVTDDFKGYMLFAFENCKVAKVQMSEYQTKTNRKKLIKAYCEKFPLAQCIYLPEDAELVLESSSGHLLLINTAVIAPKTTKGERIKSLKKRLTPVWTVLTSLVIRVMSEDEPSLSVWAYERL